MTLEGVLETARALPATVAMVVIGLLTATLLVGLSLRYVVQHLASIRSQILVIALSSLGTGAAIAVALSWLMIVDGDTLERVVTVIVLMSPLVAVLVVMATAPMGRDVLKLERALNQLESGDHDVSVGLHRSDEIGRVSFALESLSGQLDAVERLRAATDTERQRVEAERRYLLSSVSHDLRTPLAAMRAAVEALSDGVAADPQRYLASMAHDIDALTSLVDDLFLLAQVEAGRMEVEPALLDFSELVDEAAEALQPVADRRGISIVPNTSVAAPVMGNAGALGRVVRNLLDNAIRHSPSGGTVHLVVEAENSVSFTVLDQGAGFPVEFVDRAFDRFARAETSRNRAHGGSGLGLAIAKSVVAAHDGKISVRPGPGGHVSVTLPSEDLQRRSSARLGPKSLSVT